MRIEPAKPDGRVWQVSIEAGFDAIFDSQNRLDVVGWDGNYGLMLTTASSSPIALKIAVPHISAHVGDEYQERIGHPRINYTRDELSVGATWRWFPPCQERDWRVDVTTDFGIVIRGAGRASRIFVEWRRAAQQ